MTTFAAPLDRAVVGFDPGWLAVFYRERADRPDTTERSPLTLTHGGYRADLRVTRSTALRGATFELTVDGLSPADRGLIISENRVFVALSMGWRDLAVTGAGAAGAAVASLFDVGEGTLHPVVIGRILQLRVAAGEFHERTTFTGVGEGFHRLATSTAPLRAARSDVHAVDAIADLVTALVERTAVHRDGGLPTLDVVQPPDRSASTLQAVTAMARRSHADGDDRELPIFFRVESDPSPAEVLHVGHWEAPIGRRHALHMGTGVAEVRPVLPERGADATGSPFTAPDARSLTYDVVLLGRADIGVADVVTLDVDELTGGPALDSLVDAAGFSMPASVPGGEDTPTFDVVEVEHSLTTTGGFVTTLRVAPHPTTPTRAQVEESSAARAIASRISAQRSAIEMRMWEVGVVREQSARRSGSGGATVHAQRRTICSGLAPSASPNRVVNADLHETTTTLTGRPYLTPFAWKQSGLVVPHYPGTRVVDLHYQGLTAEGAIAGAVWEEGDEPPAQVGDWWLSLPTGVTEAESTEDPRTVADPPADMLCAHDLIDADGARAIHVAGLTVTVGRGLMPAIGVRPDDPPQGSVEIRSDENNARIVIDADGNIEIATDGDLTFRANKITAHVTDSFEVQ